MDKISAAMIVLASMSQMDTHICYVTIGWDVEIDG